MRIDKFSDLRSIVGSKGVENTEKIKEETKVSQPKDTYTFQTQAKELNELFELAKATEELSAEKLEKIREKIESNEYQVKGKDVVLKVLGDKLHGTKNN